MSVPGKGLQADTSVATPIVGVVRFSVLTAGPSDFRGTAKLTIEERARVLFDPAHLETRFKTFEALTLPSLTSQTVDDWHAVILFSDRLPTPWRDRLMDLTAPHPHILPVEMSVEASIAPVLHQTALSLSTGTADRVAMFRIDDDDGLSSGFVRRLRDVADHAGQRRVGITFPRGYLLGRHSDGERMLALAPFRRFGIGCGLTVVGPSAPDFGVFDLGVPHQRIDEIIPTLSDSHAPNYVIFLHDHNDSGQDTRRHAQIRKADAIQPRAAARKLGDDFAHLRLDMLVD
ncbi:MAG: glycosyltransferase [Pseudomonadota bacterium]